MPVSNLKQGNRRHMNSMSACMQKFFVLLRAADRRKDNYATEEYKRNFVKPYQAEGNIAGTKSLL